MNTVKIKSYAKINMTLEVVGVENGYHMLDSLVASIDLYDLIVLKKRKDGLSSVMMHGKGSEGIAPEQNVALRAAELFSKTFQTSGADITIYKDIPIGAGLGGSSADAAGVLNGMATLYGVKDFEKLQSLALCLGSDTAYMLSGGFARMQGRGERITPLNVEQRLHFLLLCPKDGVSSKACYQMYDKLPKTLEFRESQTAACIEALQKKEENEVGRYLMNDLFVSAMHLNKSVEIAHQEALSFSPLGVTMTGSGSAVLALFDSKELCEWAKSRYKGRARAYVVSTCIPDYKKEKKKSLFRNPFMLTQEELEEIGEK